MFGLREPWTITNSRLLIFFLKIQFLQLKEQTQKNKKMTILCYIRKKSKNAYKKRKNENFEKKCVSFSYPKDHSTKKLGSQAKRCALQPVHRRTHTQTHTKVATEGTLSGFQDFSLQPIIKDGPNIITIAGPTQLFQLLQPAVQTLAVELWS